MYKVLYVNSSWLLRYFVVNFLDFGVFLDYRIECIIVLSVGASRRRAPEFWMSQQCLHVTNLSEGCG